MRVANASIDILLHENMIENSENMGKMLRDGLIDISNRLSTNIPDIITDIRGRGLMNAIEISDDATCNDIVSKLAKNGIL